MAVLAGFKLIVGQDSPKSEVNFTISTCKGKYLTQHSPQFTLYAPVSIAVSNFFFFCLNCDLCFCVTGLNQWDDIEKLNFFPKLEEVRLQGIPLLQAYTNAERRSLIIAQ